jgi:hypothetical protein
VVGAATGMAVGDLDELVRPDGTDLGPPEGDSAWPVYERLIEPRDGSDRAVGDRYRLKISTQHRTASTIAAVLLSVGPRPAIPNRDRIRSLRSLMMDSITLIRVERLSHV